jgi:hypothetical protein
MIYNPHIKSVTSATHLIIRHTVPRWPCNSFVGQNTDFRTTHHGSMLINVGTPQLITVGTHVGFAAHILQAEIRACADYARLYAWLGTRSVATSKETTLH